MQRLLDCSRGVIVTVLLLVMVVVVRRCDAALQSGGQVTEVCNGNRLLGNCSTVGGALSVQLGMGGERRKEMKGELAKGVCSLGELCDGRKELHDSSLVCCVVCVCVWACRERLQMVVLF